MRFHKRLSVRKGMTAVLAMLYLTLMASLALGFYSASTTAVMVSHNEQRVEKARLAAESGLDFARFHVGKITIPKKTPADQSFELLATRLGERLNGSENLAKGSIYSDGYIIRIPGDPRLYVKSDEIGSDFQVLMEDMGEKKLRIRSVGRYNHSVASSYGRAIKLDFLLTERPSSVFSYGVASRSPITMDSNARIRGVGDAELGSVLITSMRTPPLSMSGNSQITGDVSLVNPDGNVSMSSNSSIAGSSNPSVIDQHVHSGVDDPDFPDIDTDVFKPYATNIISAPNQKFDKGTMRNLYIKANTNPTFDSNMKVEGVIYIETPNKVRFDSNVEVRGVIVVQNNPTGSVNTNSITFNSNVKLYPIESLPPSPHYPQSMRDLTGSMIIAPRFSLHFNSNFGSVGGVIAGGKIEFDSNARGSIAGTVLNLEDTSLHLDSNADIGITARGPGLPAGFGFSNVYRPLPDSYEEIPLPAIAD